MESDALHFEKAFTVHGTVFGKLSLRVEKEDFQPIALSGHQSCHGQGIAPVVAGTRKDQYRMLTVNLQLKGKIGAGPTRSLHQRAVRMAGFKAAQCARPAKWLAHWLVAALGAG